MNIFRSISIFYVFVGVFAIVLPTILAAQQETYLRNIRDVFSHKVHKPVFDHEGITCTDCHIFNVITADISEKKAKSFSYNLLHKVGRSACHLCHNNPEAKVHTKTNCNLCHIPSDPLMPLDHTADWKTSHKFRAKMDPQSCTQCHHRTRFCQECHTPTTLHLPLDRVHSGNFRHTHSIQARMNPLSCSNCHTPKNCIACHERGY